MIRSCRDCANFEERRDIDSAAVCSKNVGPCVCCEEFDPKDAGINEHRLFYRFCVECSNLENINEKYLCAKNHNPIIGCDGFQSRFEKLKLIRQNTHRETVLLEYTATYFDPKPIPGWLLEIGKTIQIVKKSD